MDKGKELIGKKVVIKDGKSEVRGLVIGWDCRPFHKLDGDYVVVLPENDTVTKAVPVDEVMVM